MNFKLSDIFLVLYLVRSIESVPADYCLYPLNTTDCGVKPIPVFSYYKEGSRCEIKTWRGCPTYNRFDNQYDCTNECIFVYRKQTAETSTAAPTTTEAAIQNEQELLDELNNTSEEDLIEIVDILNSLEEGNKIKLSGAAANSTDMEDQEGGSNDDEVNTINTVDTDITTTKAIVTAKPDEIFAPDYK